MLIMGLGCYLLIIAVSIFGVAFCEARKRFDRDDASAALIWSFFWPLPLAAGIAFVLYVITLRPVIKLHDKLTDKFSSRMLAKRLRLM